MEQLPRACQLGEKNQQRCDEEKTCRPCDTQIDWVVMDLPQPPRSQLLEVFTELNQAVKKLLTNSDSDGTVSNCDPEIERILKEISNKLNEFGPALNWKPPSRFLYPPDAVRKLPEVWPSMKAFFTGVESLKLLHSMGYSKTDYPWHLNEEARYMGDDGGHMKGCIADNQRHTRQAQAQKWVSAAWVMAHSEFRRDRKEDNISLTDISQASREARETSRLLEFFAKECERVWPVGAESPTDGGMAFILSNCEEIYLAVRPFLLVACEGRHFPQDATSASMTKDQQDLLKLVSIGVARAFSFARSVSKSTSLSEIECNACERDCILKEHKRFGAVLVLASTFTSGVYRLLPDTELTKDSLEQLIAERIDAMTSDHLKLDREILKNVKSQLALES